MTLKEYEHLRDKESSRRRKRRDWQKSREGEGEGGEERREEERNGQFSTVESMKTQIINSP